MRNLVWASALIVVSLGWGCAGDQGGAAAARDFAEARERVAAALDAWKAGGAVAPKLDDHDARSGLKLDSYEIRKPPAGWTSAVGLGAVLSLRDAKGRKFVRHAVYRVKETPEPIVSREE
jgi:hypothetical protein